MKQVPSSYVIANPPPHSDVDCPRVKNSVECPRCGYPGAEAFWLLPLCLFNWELYFIFVAERSHRLLPPPMCEHHGIPMYVDHDDTLGCGHCDMDAADEAAGID